MDTLNLDRWAWSLGDDTDGWILASGSAEWPATDLAARGAALGQAQALLQLCRELFGPADDEDGDWSFALEGEDRAPGPPGGWDSAHLDLRLHPGLWPALCERADLTQDGED